LEKLDTLAEESEHFGEEVRELAFGKRRSIYRILFAIRGDQVHVFTIRHGARDALQ